MKNLQDRVAVITGAGNGIGRSLARLLAEKGCHLALVDIREPGLTETQASLSDLDREVSLHVADVSDKSRMETLPEEIAEAHGHIHLLINNAGVGVYKTIEQHTLEDMEWILGINLWGVIYGCKFFLPYLRKEPEAHIVNLSSMLGIIGLPRQGSYSASKFAVRGFTEALWGEMKGTNIHVSIVHPGAVKTNILNTARYSDKQTETDLRKIVEKYAPSAEKAAKTIVKGIQGNRHRILICPETHLIDLGKRLFPTLMNRLVG